MAATPPPVTIKLDQQFINFSKFGDTKADGKTIMLSQIDKWFKQANIFDKKLTPTDTGITFNKYKSKTITFPMFVAFLEDLAGQKKMQSDDLKQKLMDCGPPGVTIKPSAAAAASTTTTPK